MKHCGNIFDITLLFNKLKSRLLGFNGYLINSVYICVFSFFIIHNFIMLKIINLNKYKIIHVIRKNIKYYLFKKLFCDKNIPQKD